jgi:hypothetical protein
MNKLIMCLVMLSAVQIASADILYSDNTNERITSYTDKMFQIWQSTGERSVQKIVISPINGNLYGGYAGLDTLVKEFDSAVGAYIARTVPAGVNSGALQFGNDFNGDGIGDLWVVGADTTSVYDGKTTPGGNPATLLASWTIANSSGGQLGVQDGAGGSDLLFGPDITGDGIPELYTVKGMADAWGNGRINVWNTAASTVSTLVQVASYTTGLRELGAIVLGPDVNADNQLDLLIVNSRDYQIRAYNYKTGAYLGILEENLTSRYFPLELEVLPNGSMLMGTRMKTELDPGHVAGVETSGGNLIRLDRAAGTALAYTPTLLAIAPGTGRVTGVAYLAKAANDPVPANGKKVMADANEISWTLPEPNGVGGVITCDVWFSETYPKYLPHLEPNVSSLADPNLWYVENQSFTSYATKVINNQAVTLLDLSTVTTLPLTEGKTYYWRVDIRDSSDPSMGTSIGKVWKFTVDNTPPDVDAGGAVYTWLTGGTVDVTMAPTVADDGRPNPPGVTTVLWEELPDSPNLVINSPTVQNTTVTITATGTYTLKLTANDSQYANSDIVAIHVYTDSCAAAQGVPGYVRPTADFDNDCDVDINDILTFAGQWMNVTVLAEPLP